MAIVVLSAASLLLPNLWFAEYGALAVVLAAVFLLAQTIIVMDLAYRWNEIWFGAALKARRELRNGAHKAHLGGIIGVATVLLVSAFALDVRLFLHSDEVGAR